jgi:hypothetical protein
VIPSFGAKKRLTKSVLPRRGNADASQLKLRELRKIRLHRTYSFLRIELRDVVEGFQDTLRFESKPFQKRLRRLTLHRCRCREIHAVECAQSLYIERPGTRLEADRRSLVLQLPKENTRCAA